MKKFRIKAKMAVIKVKVFCLEIILNKIPRLFNKNSEQVYVYDLYEDDLFELEKKLEKL